jgi:hypothetical protein
MSELAPDAAAEMVARVMTTAPVMPLTDITSEEPPSTLSHTEPSKITRSPTDQLLIPSRVVVPATLTL